MSNKELAKNILIDNFKYNFDLSEIMRMDISIFLIKKHFKENPVDISKFNLPKKKRKKIEKFIKSLPKPAP